MNFWFFLAWLYFTIALSNPAFWGLAIFFFMLGLNQRSREAKENEKPSDKIDLKK